VPAVQLYHYKQQKLEGEWSGNEASKKVWESMYALITTTNFTQVFLYSYSPF